MMPSYNRAQTLDARVAILEEQVAAAQRGGRLVDDLAMFPVYYFGMEFVDVAASMQIAWQNIFTPRSGTLTLGLQLAGDQVSGVNTGGVWDVQLNGQTVANGTVPATFSIVQPVVKLDLTPYLGVTDLLVTLRTQRTSGASTGGRYGTGGCIASGLLFARMS